MAEQRMITHEPCASRDDCYHARAGRIGGPIGGRISGRIAVESGQLARISTSESRAKGGRIGGPIGGYRNVESGHLASIAAKGGRVGGPIVGRIQGHKNVESGHLARITTPESCAKGGRIAAEILGQKPNRKEATVAALLMTFYPDVWADIIWQRPLPRSLRGVPDLRHPIDVIGEYDGGGHNAFGNRRADDAAKDAERRVAGYAIVRETDPYVLVAKFAYAVRKRFRPNP